MIQYRALGGFIYGAQIIAVRDPDTIDIDVIVNGTGGRLHLTRIGWCDARGRDGTAAPVGTL